MKTQEIIDNGDRTISLRTVEEKIVSITPDEVVAMERANADDILRVENEIRGAQQRLVDLQAEAAAITALSTRAKELVPVKEDAPLEGEGLLGG